ncbi:MAG: HupE/UreJ family protein [Microvirga sp.]|nr:HupE/UreJ family protein [Beijerinckiaceae bacterium]
MLARLALALLILAATAAGAEAHHVMGGTTPQTLAQGLLSGLAHPVIGLDHLAFTVAAGLLAARLAPPLAPAVLMPLAFLVAGAVGASLHLAGVDLPGAEIAVALSVLALAGLILSGRTLPALRLAALFAAAGLFHGHALAESIVGAEPAPLAAYFAGLVAVQYAIALAAMLAARWIAAERPALSRPAATAAGIAIAAVGIGALVAGI